MLKGLKRLNNKINNNLREEIITRLTQIKNIDLAPRQKKIIKFLSNINSSFMKDTEEIATRFKVSQRTIQKDLKLLRDFKLVERVKVPGKRKYYFRLNVELSNIKF